MLLHKRETLLEDGNPVDQRGHKLQGLLVLLADVRDGRRVVHRGVARARLSAYAVLCGAARFGADRGPGAGRLQNAVFD